MFKKNANFETIHHSQNNEFGFEKKKFLPQNNEVAEFGYTKTKEKQIFILYVLPFDKLMLLFHENMNYGSLFQLYQEFWPNVFMC